MSVKISNISAIISNHLVRFWNIQNNWSEISKMFVILNFSVRNLKYFDRDLEYFGRNLEHFGWNLEHFGRNLKKTFFDQKTSKFKEKSWNKFGSVFIPQRECLRLTVWVLLVWMAFFTLVYCYDCHPPTNRDLYLVVWWTDGRDGQAYFWVKCWLFSKLLGSYLRSI